MKVYTKHFIGLLKAIPRWMRDSLALMWRTSIWNRLLLVLIAVVIGCIGTMYGIARWYIASESSKPFVLGASFVPDYAEYLGLDPQDTMDALINDVGVQRFRLVSYWGDIEATKGKYDFSQLDWQFQKAEAAGAKISLSLGLRQPRWPECHMPDWAASEPKRIWQPQLAAQIAAVVNRYKTSPALESYQLENEYFLQGFGTCSDFDRTRLVSEFNLVKRLDPNHKLIVTRSNNGVGWPVGDPKPDEYGISLYRRVWDAGVTKRYFQHPEPAWYYAFVAGSQKLLTGKDMFIHEMQTEPWPPNGQTIPATTLTEQNKSFNARRLHDAVDYARATGMREAYLWGAEYWYYRATKLGDSSVWDAARLEFAIANQTAIID